MNCENCQCEMNQVGQRHFECKPCGVVLEASDKTQPQTASEPNGQSLDGIIPLGKQTGFMCPNCAEENLCVGSIRNTQVCFCENCFGFVVDRVSLGELIESLRAEYDGPERVIPLDQVALHTVCKCPACFEKMETFAYYGPGNVVIDSCEGCKLSWLNDGELSVIIESPGKRNYEREQTYIAIGRPGGSGIEVDGAANLWLMGEMLF